MRADLTAFVVSTQAVVSPPILLYLPPPQPPHQPAQSANHASDSPSNVVGQIRLFILLRLYIVLRPLRLFKEGLNRH